MELAKIMDFEYEIVPSDRNQGGNSIENFGLSFGLNNSLRFHFYSVTYLNYNFFELFISVWNLNLKCFSG